MAVEHARVSEILRIFERVSAIPRPSRREERIASWLVSWAHDRGLEAVLDEAGNVLVRVAASPGLEAAPTVVLQGHMDMVCEKVRGSGHDFEVDPIRLVRDGDWLRADGTSLGADNGIAIAMALALVESRDAVHPPLELLFTVDEETGLTGAGALSPGLLRGRILLNLDSEDEGVLTVGCAGGCETSIHLPLEREAAPAGLSPFRLAAGGMTGGHSGVDIHEQRCNAIRVLGSALDALSRDGPLRISELAGGTAHNAIPRDAEAVLLLPAGRAGSAARRIAALSAELRRNHAPTDPSLSISLEPAAPAAAALSHPASRRVVDLLLALPHGVAEMSLEVPGLVQTSNNLARAELKGGGLYVTTSQRSSAAGAAGRLSARIEAIARLAGAAAHSHGGYPGWQPDMDSPLLALCRSAYRELFGREPVIEAIHAGLECGVIGSKYPGMDMISFGPTIRSPHSPDERLEIPSVGKVWKLLLAVLERIASEGAGGAGTTPPAPARPDRP